MSATNPDWLADQAKAADKKRSLISRYRGLLGSGDPNSKGDQLKILVSEFYSAGFAGKPLNDELKAELDRLRAAYDHERQQHREKRERALREAYYKKTRILERMEGIASRLGNPYDDRQEWDRLGKEFWEAPICRQRQ